MDKGLGMYNEHTQTRAQVAMPIFARRCVTLAHEGGDNRRKLVYDTAEVEEKRKRKANGSVSKSTEET